MVMVVGHLLQYCEYHLPLQKTPVPSCSNDISSVANRTSRHRVPRGRSRSRISRLSWSIAPNAEGLAAGSGSDELYLPSRRFRHIYSSSASSRRGSARRRTDRAAHIARRPRMAGSNLTWRNSSTVLGLMPRTAQDVL
jgi:hypothetical protein